MMKSWILNTMLPRIRGFRKNEHGQVMLLSGVMIFMIAMFTVVAVDSAVTIRHRIIAQNAVDSAADAAAMWQARGLNLIQHLNNFHRLINKIATGLESVGCIGCVLSPAALILSKIPLTAAVGEPLYQGVCAACVLCPWVDYAQYYVATGINYIQKGATIAFPIAAALSANANARESEADRIFAVIPRYASVGLQGVLPDPIDDIIPNTLDGAGGDFVDFLGNFPIYAFPLNPSQIALSVTNVAGDSYPWKTPESVAVMWQVAGNIGRVACNAAAAGGLVNSGMNKMSGSDTNNPWGYQSEYYEGNPGFLTWIAGKDVKDIRNSTLDLDEGPEYGVGLRDAIWLTTEADTVAVTDEVAQVWYDGDTFPANDNEHFVRPVIALASAHVEGDVVTGDDQEPNAIGHIIPVQKPNGSDTNGNEMQSIMIFH